MGLWSEGDAGADESRTIIVHNRLPVVSYRDGEIGERSLNSFYSKLKKKIPFMGEQEDPSSVSDAPQTNYLTGDAATKNQPSGDLSRVRTGLKTAMDSLELNTMLWIGWADLNDATPSEAVALRTELASRDCVPVMLQSRIFEPYFDGMCNDVLWPILHSANAGIGADSLHGQEAQWHAYVEANKAFAAEVLKTYRSGDVVFIHDYHLMLVPQILRAAEPSMRIGWFLHVPFPVESLWRTLPVRRQLLEGVLAADVVGFHTSRYARNFAAAVSSITGFDPIYEKEGSSSSAAAAASSSSSSASSGHKDDYTIGPHGCRVEICPMGIDPDRFTEALTSPEVSETLAKTENWLRIENEIPPPFSPLVATTTTTDSDAPSSSSSLVSDAITEEDQKDKEKDEARQGWKGVESLYAAAGENLAAAVSDLSNLLPQEVKESVKEEGEPAVIPNRRIMLGVDRLDYVKGLPEKLEAFELFLERYPEERGRTTLVQVAVPTRTRSPRYQKVTDRVRQIVARINGRYWTSEGSLSTPPVVYIERSIPFTEIVALYHLADVMLITSFSDGLNLVAFEYIASQIGSSERPGGLILSEFTGTAEILAETGGAVIINPYDVSAVTDAIRATLNMGNEERIDLHKAGLKCVYNNTASGWVKSIFTSLFPSKNAKSEKESDQSSEVVPELDQQTNLQEPQQTTHQGEEETPTMPMLPAASAMRNLEAFIPQGRRPVLFLDLDTIPLTEKVGQALSHVASALPTCVLSERPLNQLKPLVGAIARTGRGNMLNTGSSLDPKLWYSGSVGYEIDGPDSTGVEFRVDATYRPALEQAHGALTDLLAGIPGTAVIDQHTSINVCFKNTAPYEHTGVEAAVGEILRVSPMLQRSDIIDESIYINPKIEWNQGKAMEWLLQRLDSNGEVLPVYVSVVPEERAQHSDDIYETLGRAGGISVTVSDGDCALNDVCASYSLQTNEVDLFLRLLADSLLSTRGMPLWKMFQKQKT
eukprot:CAMPEP_0185755238 /NCGR_PEP_ID=MMETSP1174-20130828/13769_1 /TAXON_ID=35687 /ORGANISM="Dictyocha speculum, Strain CCMP1381" /LENGTH=989 /DNA_ID=CAMNT_0028433727 /DNA_START=199 /DNA_END=3168 /DNA_ORIENTATION=+